MNYSFRLELNLVLKLGSLREILVNKAQINEPLFLQILKTEVQTNGEIKRCNLCLSDGESFYSGFNVKGILAAKLEIGFYEDFSIIEIIKYDFKEIQGKQFIELLDIHRVINGSIINQVLLDPKELPMIEISMESQFENSFDEVLSDSFNDGDLLRSKTSSIVEIEDMDDSFVETDDQFASDESITIDDDQTSESIDSISDNYCSCLESRTHYCDICHQYYYHYD